MVLGRYLIVLYVVGNFVPGVDFILGVDMSCHQLFRIAVPYYELNCAWYFLHDSVDVFICRPCPSSSHEALSS